MVCPDVRASIVDALCLFGDRPRPTRWAPVVQTSTSGMEASAQHCGTIACQPSVAPSLIYQQAGRALGKIARTSIWVSTVTEAPVADYLWRRGCPLGGRVLGMIADASSWAPVSTSVPGIQLVPVEASRQAELFRAFRRGLGEPEGYVDFFARDAVVFDDSCEAVVTVNEAGRACGGGMVVYSPDSARAGLYWLATAPGYRRRGIGSAITTLLTNRAFDRHRCHRVGLQATPAGAAIYEPLGYRPAAFYDRFILAR